MPRPTGLLSQLRAIFVGAGTALVAPPDRTSDAAPALAEIDDAPTLEDALASERAIIYKHSTRCPVSSIVIHEVIRFGETHPDWKLYLLKVVERRGLSNAVAERLDVRHASPQVFVIKQGRCVWHTSHSGITEHGLRQHAG